MRRLLFEKTGSAVWMSHLDLMRLMQRAFKRAGLPLTHSHGYNPRPSVSIAMPLSVGVESVCELLDFDLDTDATISCDEIQRRLNDTLVPGVKIRQVYEGGRKLKELAFLQCEVTLEYDRGVPESALEKITALFQRESLIVPKKTKNGTQDQDIIPMIRKITAEEQENKILLWGCICCQNPSLNPMQLAQAVTLHLPDVAPDFSHCKRIELLDSKEKIFR